jgi:hypothetical protein
VTAARRESAIAGTTAISAVIAMKAADLAL